MYYRGNYSQKPEFPSGIGYEVVGTVVAVGEGVDSSLTGRRIGTIPIYSMNQYPVLGERALGQFCRTDCPVTTNRKQEIERRGDYERDTNCRNLKD
jgi:D-arabinose 1-dehydrogenase-like Zn-dependent alcohol dehydrogenase